MVPFQKRINANALTKRVWDSDADLMGRAKSKVPTSHSCARTQTDRGLACVNAVYIDMQHACTLEDNLLTYKHACIA